MGEGKKERGRRKKGGRLNEGGRENKADRTIRQSCTGGEKEDSLRSFGKGRYGHILLACRKIKKQEVSLCVSACLFHGGQLLMNFMTLYIAFVRKKSAFGATVRILHN